MGRADIANSASAACTGNDFSAGVGVDRIGDADWTAISQESRSRLSRCQIDVEIAASTSGVKDDDLITADITASCDMTGCEEAWA